MDEKVVSAEPFGNGHINDTLKVTNEKGEIKYVLQRINHLIFTNVDMLQNNIHVVTTHIRKKLEEKGETDIDRKVLTFLPTKDGKKYYFDGDSYWRVCLFIPRSKSYEEVTPELSYEAGKAFGDFQTMLSDIPEGTLGETIPDFHNMEFRLRQFHEAVAANPAYEFGFDYLRDNMVIYKENMVQRDLSYAIVDEVDSILIDEARTPLIISGQGDKSTQLYTIVDSFVARLKGQRVTSVDTKEEEDPDIDADYIVDEKARTVTLTARGIAKAEQQFQIENLSDPENTTLSHHINQAIRARGLMKRDIDYVVKDGEVIIVDEFTGRLMFGRRYSNGLHQAIEAKEHVNVNSENKTLATITFQNYFRLYDKLSGMTGTAMTEAEEFGTIYNLDIVEIPTNRPNQRVDHHDVVYKTEAGKFRAVIQQVKECHEKGQPVLVGTVSIEKNELLSHLLQREGIQHNLLNAKNHEKEAEIVAQAGKLGAVTVATNMAGRGTDIMLGGNAEYLSRADLVKAGYSEEVIVDATGYAETDNADILAARKLFAERMAYHKAIIKEEAERVRAAGGLFIIGTERHDSRRIDNQLRGRAGRQGDPGETRFYISLEDDLMRLFGGDRIQNMMEKFDLDEDTPIENKMLTRAIENAQTTVESRNFQSRKSVLEYDDVMNKQREIIYAQRRQVLDGLDIKETVLNIDAHLRQQPCGAGLR